MIFGKDKKCSYDMLLVGLGNYGDKYVGTRHNAGFMVADKFCERHGATLKRLKCKALICESKVASRRILVAFPQTYMNASGEAVSAICQFYKIPSDKILVVFDDISLDVGNIRIRRNGSHGGHNGMKDISERMNTTDIMRIKIGVGAKPHPDYDLADWVISKFRNDEKENLEKGLTKAVDAIDEILTGTVERAMNKFNS
ncbi:MAG: aminoacyl-tRNA hydrolase [Clostridiales bacterium]|nr:aminoacyl-tRNA hydrolase [Candidatus Equinaster intestinalis]